MTGFLLMQLIDYEGAHVLGLFSELSDIEEFLKEHRVFSEQVVDLQMGQPIQFHPDEHLANKWNAPRGTTACWKVHGTLDCTFVVYSFALS
jgi:hypothetical protein